LIAARDCWRSLGNGAALKSEQIKIWLETAGQAEISLARGDLRSFTRPVDHAFRKAP
jgi:hypothetical protein